MGRQLDWTDGVPKEQSSDPRILQGGLWSSARFRSLIILDTDLVLMAFIGKDMQSSQPCEPPCKGEGEHACGEPFPIVAYSWTRPHYSSLRGSLNWPRDHAHVDGGARRT